MLVYVDANACNFVDIFIPKYIYVYASLSLYICVYIYICIYICLIMHTLIGTYIHAYIYTFVHTYTCICIDANAHTLTLRVLSCAAPMCWGHSFVLVGSRAWATD